jgi:hypothetical protein
MSNKANKDTTLKDRNNREGDTRIYSRSSFLYKMYLSVGEEWYHKGHQCYKGSLYSLVSEPQRLVHTTLSGALEGRNRDLYTKGWGKFHNLIGDSQQHHNLFFTNI